MKETKSKIHAWLCDVKIEEDCMYIKEKEKMEKDACVAVADQYEHWGMQSCMETRHQM